MKECLILRVKCPYDYCNSLQRVEIMAVRPLDDKTLYSAKCKNCKQRFGLTIRLQTVYHTTTYERKHEVMT